MLLLLWSRLLLLLSCLHMLHLTGHLSHPTLLRSHRWPHLILLLVLLRRLLMLLKGLMWMCMHSPGRWSATERLLLRRLLMLESVHLLLRLLLLHSLLHLHLLRLLLLVEAVLLGMVHLLMHRLLSLLGLLRMRRHLHVLRYRLPTHMLAMLANVMLLLLQMLWVPLYMLWLLGHVRSLLGLLLMLWRYPSLWMALLSKAMIQVWAWPPFEHMG